MKKLIEAMAIASVVFVALYLFAMASTSIARRTTLADKVRDLQDRVDSMDLRLKALEHADVAPETS